MSGSLPARFSPFRLPAVLVLCGAIALAGAADVRLAVDGEARAAIVADGHDQLAAALADYLGRIAGAEFPVVATLADAPAERALIVLAVADAVPGTSDRPTGEQGYRLHTEAGRLHLTGRSELALTYAVYGFLEDHLGVHFYDADAERVPARPTIVIGPLDDSQEPAFISRRGIDQRDSLWLLKNRGGGTPGLWSNHSFYRWIPPAEYLETHPEWFALIDGTRQAHDAMSLCGTNEALATELARKLMETMADADPATPLRVGQGDGFKACECADCRALVEREESEAAPYLLMLNRVLDITTRQYPEHRIVTFAYYGTLPAPATMRPHDNLLINVVATDITRNSDQLGPIRGNPANAASEAAYIAWPRLAPGRVSAWHWSINFRAQTTEWPSLFSMCDNFRFWRDAGLVAAHPEGANDRPGGNWIILRRWLYLKMMWNPDADEHELIPAFLAGYYGEAAAPALWEYLRYTADLAVASGLAASGLTDAHVLRRAVFTDAALARMTALLETALAAARGEADPVYAERVELAIATSVDVLHFMDEDGVLKPLTRVIDPRDDSLWLVPGGRSDAPERLARLDAAYRKTMIEEWAAGWFSRLRFLGYFGGPVHRLENASLAVEVVPNFGGQMTRLVYKPTGDELLAWTDATPRRLLAYRPAGHSFGYADEVAAVSMQEWRVLDDPPAANTLPLAGYLHRSAWWESPKHRGAQELRRTLILDEAAPALTVERVFDGQALANHLAGCMLPDPTRFNSRWRFASPLPAAAGITIEGGGISRALTLAEAGETELTVTAAEGDLTIAFDRGDGLVVRLTTPAAGWEQVSIVPGPGLVTLTLTGKPWAMSLTATRIDDLPPQRLDVLRR